MFDIDGTLINSSTFEDVCYLAAVKKIVDYPIDTNWKNYPHVSDAGILDEIIMANNLVHDRDSIHKQVKSHFLILIAEHLSHSPVQPIPGAAQFILMLQQRTDVEVAIATGGWEETAKLKLYSGGIDLSGISFASSSDHFSRIEIMKKAEQRCSNKNFKSRTYFGDAVWDKQASEALGYNFILVGEAYIHAKQIQTFDNPAAALELIGL